MSLTQPMSLDDDVGAVFLDSIPADTVKAPASETTTPSVQPQTLANAVSSHLPATERKPDGACLTNPPPLPQRNGLRSSRFLDDLCLQPASSPAAVSTMADKAGDSPLPTPHDVYLSSEEDASSAGDVSEYDEDDEYADSGEDDEYDTQDGGVVLESAQHVRVSSPEIPSRKSISSASSAPSPPSPTATAQPRRHSHDTARMVSVVFSGKPSLIDLATKSKRNPRCRSCIEPAMQSMLSSSASSTSASSCLTAASGSEVPTRPSTSSDSFVSRSSSQSSMLLSFQDRRCAMDQTRPETARAPSTSAPTPASIQRASQAFLHTDPFAKATTAIAPPQPRRSFTAPHSSSAAVSAAAPPTSQSMPSTHSGLLRGVTRSLTLSRRRSRPVLRVEALSQQALGSPVTPPLPSSASVASLASLAPSPAPSPVTYNDIVRSARRKSTALSAISATPPIVQEMIPEDRPLTPMSAAIPGSLRRSGTVSFLGSFSSRRRSLKMSRQGA